MWAYSQMLPCVQSKGGKFRYNPIKAQHALKRAVARAAQGQPNALAPACPHRQNQCWQGVTTGASGMSKQMGHLRRASEAGRG